MSQSRAEVSRKGNQNAATKQRAEGFVGKLALVILGGLIAGGAPPWWWKLVDGPQEVRVSAVNTGQVVESHKYRVSDAALLVSRTAVWVEIKTEPRGVDRKLTESESPWINFEILDSGGTVILTALDRSKGRVPPTASAPGEVRMDITGWLKLEGVEPAAFFAQADSLTFRLLLPS